MLNSRAGLEKALKSVEKEILDRANDGYEMAILTVPAEISEKIASELSISGYKLTTKNHPSGIIEVSW